VVARGIVSFRDYKRDGSGSGAGGNGMRDELTDSQIALLCDIEESDLTKFDGDRKRDLGGFSQRVTLSRRTAIWIGL
jgi:hypothetical protein